MLNLFLRPLIECGLKISYFHENFFQKKNLILDVKILKVNGTNTNTKICG